MAAAAFVTDLTEILTQAAEAAAGLASIYQGYELLQISRDYYNLYKRQRDFYYSTFQQGVEIPLTAEIYNDPKPVLDYAGQVATAYNSDTGPFGGKSTDVDGWWLRHAQAYNTVIDANLGLELQTDKMRVKSDWTNYLFRFEEVHFDTKSDIRWRKRLAVHNIGLKIGSGVSSALDSSLDGYRDQINDSQNQLATYGNGIARYVGYKRGLEETADAYETYGNRRPLPSSVQYNAGERPYASDHYRDARAA